MIRFHSLAVSSYRLAMLLLYYYFAFWAIFIFQTTPNIIAASLLQRYIRLLPVISSLHCRRLHPKTAYGSRHSIVDRSLPYNNHEMQSAVFLIQTAVDDKGFSFHIQNAASASMSPFFLSFSSSCLYHNFRARESFPSNLILYYKL